MAENNKPFLAYAVLEQNENTGGIIYAQHSVTARRIGANEYANGEFSYVTCTRAPWADPYFDTTLPVSVMILHGWHFECAGCGRRVDEDMIYDRQIHPDDVVGHQHSMVFCDARCEAALALERANCEHLKKRWLRRFAKFAKRRFPASQPVEAHAYASCYDGKCRIQEVAVEIDFPGRSGALAQLSWRRQSRMRGDPYPKPIWLCSAVDRDVFQAYARSTKSPTASTVPSPPAAVEDAAALGER